jgi:peptide deformylase
VAAGATAECRLTDPDLRVVPDPVLRQRCEPIRRFDRGLADLAGQMQRVMLAHGGIGLAAPQIGVLQRLVVLLIDNEPQVIANPTIDWTSGISVLNEGCLSCPGILVRVQRGALVIVEGQHLDGTPVTYRFSKMLAHCIQHEIDHLDGRLILDYGPAQTGEAKTGTV